MNITDLPADTQALLSVAYEQQLKFYLVFFFAVWAALYLFYFKPRQEPTQWILVGLVRGIITILSFFMLYAIPMFFFLFNPYVGISDFYLYMVIMYSITGMLGIVIMFFNIVYYLPLFIMNISNFTRNEHVANLPGSKFIMKEYKKFQNKP